MLFKNVLTKFGVVYRYGDETGCNPVALNGSLGSIPRRSTKFKYGSMAQLAAQETFNLKVVGSNPTGPTIYCETILG